VRREHRRLVGEVGWRMNGHGDSPPRTCENNVNGA
jgi:hypothetical protein